MAEALVSSVVEQLGSIMVRELEQEVRLVVGVEKEVAKLTSNLTAIQAVIADAETKQVKDATVKDWLEKLKDVAYDIEDVLDDWKAAILSSQNKPGDEQEPKTRRKVCFFLRSSCICCKQVGLRHDIANKIKELKERLDDIAQEKARYHFVAKEGNPPIEPPRTTSMIDLTEVKGREEEKSVLVNKLLSDGNRLDLRVFSIVGLGGIGKTTLAQFAFNDDRIKAYFDKKIWVCVSDPFDETRVAKAILESLLGSTPGVTELESLLQKIGETIQGKKYLLILDDVWEENPNKWHRLKQSLSCGSPGSKVLVTTRKENVASAMGCFKDDILKVGILSDEVCWLIVSKIALFDQSTQECKRLEEIGRNLSSRCRGLPLAAKVLGGILQIRKSREEWESVLKSEIWEQEEVQRDIFPPLLLSYLDLSPTLKRCFSYCAIFSKDYEIEKKQLVELWMAQGFLKQKQNDDDLELIGEYYFQNLAKRSFFQDFVKDPIDDHIIYSCKMHDIVHDFVQVIAQNECHSVRQDGPMELVMSSVSRNVRHLGLTLSKRELSLDAFKGLRKMRSLLLLFLPFEGEVSTVLELLGIRRGDSSRLSSKITGLSSLFSELTHVRSLGLKNGDFAEIPSSISKLVQLRWLDLSRNRELKQLPETLCELPNLQTIDVTKCRDLELPLGIGKLINLRHLQNYEGPGRLPKGIAQLTGLRTLEVVDVGCDGDAFSLGDLKNLNQLRGRLSIENLGAHNHHVREAKEAELKKKEGITRLELQFKSREDGEGQEELDHLLEALEPSPNLEILGINRYKGTTFPDWMMSLTNLRSILLSICASCEQLPSLGKLPSLEILRFWGMFGVKKVGVELLGIKTPPQLGDRKSQIISASSFSSSSSSSSPVVVVAFPKLTRLEFYYMSSWEEWDDYYYDNDGTTKTPSITIMPSLHSLHIGECRHLKALPNFILQNTMLHTLVISASNLLAKRYNKEKGEDWSKISHIPHVSI